MKKSSLRRSAPPFKPSGTPLPVQFPSGYCYDGTDVGAMIQEFFFVEAPTTNYRRILPHGHVTYSGGTCNVSYTSRLGTKIGMVLSQTDWDTVEADSGPIFNGMFKFVWQG